MDIKQKFELYKKWVIKNPRSASELETLVKVGSLLFAGHIQNPGIKCEFFYAGSGLFKKLNDLLIYGEFPHLAPVEFNKLTILLSVVEYIEVLIEVSATQLWGETGKWAVVSIIQLLKTIWRLILLLQNKIRFVASPAIASLNRLEAEKCLSSDTLKCGFESAKQKGIVRLPRSGTLMRLLEGTPPPHLRTFTSHRAEEFEFYSVKARKCQALPAKGLFGEVLHIFRPLGHLSSMYLFGIDSWIPWCLALGIDLTSLHLHAQSALTKEERDELVSRRIGLLYYLIRTPAFHAVTHRRIQDFLITAEEKIPLAKFICQPLLEYITEWQKIYSYTWS